MPKSEMTIGEVIRGKRIELGLSSREVARQSGVNDATISRIERGDISRPNPETLQALAVALSVNLADLYLTADYTVPEQLPSFRPYLRTKYRELPAEAVSDLDEAFQRILQKHGYEANGPQAGEDEAA